MGISAGDVKKLREKTGAGMMECKNALVETGGDFTGAEKLLKEKGLAAVEKRSDRAAKEGKIFVKIRDNGAVLVELSTETDFVARNPEFIALGDAVVDRVLEKGYTGPNEELAGMVTDLAAKIRENMSLKRIKLVPAGDGEYLVKYIHGDGAIGVVVKLSAGSAEALQKEEFKALAFNLALHIAAFNPAALDRNHLDAAFLKEQEEIFRKQLEGDEKLQGKPAAVIENILKGKMNKYLSDICLMEQGYVKDEKIPVAQVLSDMGKHLGTVINVVDYVYFKVGDS
ncbi:MAG: translation elongation factor Ts [Spirochaetaceae bacterium]|jgi:elongation factor Ts|nr:translation elongation factor Ts [Spirochaetaceae bacterium]